MVSLFLKVQAKDRGLRSPAEISYPTNLPYDRTLARKPALSRPPTNPISHTRSIDNVISFFTFLVYVLNFRTARLSGFVNTKHGQRAFNSNYIPTISSPYPSYSIGTRISLTTLAFSLRHNIATPSIHQSFSVFKKTRLR